MSLPQVTILGFHKKTHWSSLRIINQRLENLFRQKYQITSVFADDESPALPLSDAYALLDHRWSSIELLTQVAKTKKPVWLYVFGDLTIRLKDLNLTLQALEGSPVHIVLASSAQKKLFLLLYPELEGNVVMSPYPVSSDFKFDPQSRMEICKEFSIPQNSKIVGYAGRWSEQKGTLDLLKAARLLDDENLHVILAGHSDNLGFAQLTGLWVDESFPKKISPLVTKNVHLTQSLTPDKMPAFLSALDLFVCTGCFHDEDYNLTAAEALTVGTPCLLSAWGGHLDHAQRVPQSVSLLTPQAGGEGYKISINELAQKMNDANLNKVSRLQIDYQAPEIPSTLLKNISLNSKAQRMMERVDFLSLNGKLDQDFYQWLYRSYL